MTDAALNALREKAREFLSRDVDRRILLRPREAMLIIDQALLWRGRCRETTIRVPKLAAAAETLPNRLGERRAVTSTDANTRLVGHPALDSDSAGTSIAVSCSDSVTSSIQGRQA